MRFDFAGGDLDRSVWVPYYLPHWSSRAASAATYVVRDGELRDAVRVDALQRGEPAEPRRDVQRVHPVEDERVHASHPAVVRSRARLREIHDLHRRQPMHFKVSFQFSKMPYGERM